MRPTITKDLREAQEALNRVAASWNKQPPESLPDVAAALKGCGKTIDAILGDYERKPGLLARCKELARKSNALQFMGDRFVCVLEIVPAMRFNLDRFKLAKPEVYQEFCEPKEQERVTFKAKTI